MVHTGTYAQARSINAAAFNSQVLEGNETMYGFDLFEDDELIIGRSAIMGISYPDCAHIIWQYCCSAVCSLLIVCYCDAKTLAQHR